jgi:hypothetical protein
MRQQTAQWPAGKIGGLTGEEATLIQLVLSSILLRGSVRLLPYASKKTEKISIPRKRKRGIMAPHLSRDREKKGGKRSFSIPADRTAIAPACTLCPLLHFRAILLQLQDFFFFQKVPRFFLRSCCCCPIGLNCGAS